MSLPQLGWDYFGGGGMLGCDALFECRRSVGVTSHRRPLLCKQGRFKMLCFCGKVLGKGQLTTHAQTCHGQRAFLFSMGLEPKWYLALYRELNLQLAIQVLVNSKL